MIDIHSHILFDVDDGCENIEESIEILKKAAERGITEIILTPHYTDVETFNREKVCDSYSKLKEKISNLNIDIKVFLGNEIAVYGNIKEILKANNFLRLANSKYILIEFPLNLNINYVIDTIKKIKEHGLIPIIAHPERTLCFKNNYNLLIEAVNSGAYLQCNSGSFIGMYGCVSKKIVKNLLRDNLITFIATDVHSIRHNGFQKLGKVEIKIEEAIGRYNKNKLFTYNARNILLDREINKEEFYEE